MTLRGRRNCITCTRWRPVSDYKPYIYRQGQYGEKENLRGQCFACRKEKEKQRQVKDQFVKEYDRIKAKVRREAKGVVPRNFTGIKSPGKKAKPQTLLRYYRERATATRRRKGIQPRKIGPKNKGKYGQPALGLEPKASRPLKNWKQDVETLEQFHERERQRKREARKEGRYK